MTVKALKLLLVSTPIGFLGSGQGGGVELTLISLVKGLLELGHEVVLIAPNGSELPKECEGVEIRYVSGFDQPSWQHQDYGSPVIIPANGVLPMLWEKALDVGKEDFDAILNFGYDWLPLWLTPHVEPRLFHLISMGAVSKVIKDQIMKLSKTQHSRLAFHTHVQASDYELSDTPTVVGNGFDLNQYKFQSKSDGPLGWAGRVAPEKGLEDAVAVAAHFDDTLLVWGLIEDENYARTIEESYPPGTIDWRGFLKTNEFQDQLGKCRALINTPKWNEAYGNVVVEALACGVPVVAYKRGGPGELIQSGSTGWLVAPDDLDALISATYRVNEIDRLKCRNWAIDSASSKGFAKRITSWVQKDIME
ncbi:glycosyltransferase family 4 protein [Prochlorococcus marinus]|uniref:Glycosyl transferase group 1 n=1 Tax=Prochlorococcus marinus (strain MIT 9211) TaxID=93059 RepID=A9BBI4_PROM4|nr:glycosyltransferase family 4 protein [Prochlorococcus marinus]ABX09196.1 Glycosyl transferase group 1 [Prochlorococcus marinus str. MIT 9211]